MHNKVESLWQRKKPIFFGILAGLVMYVFSVLLISGMAVEVLIIISLLVGITIVIWRATDPSLPHSSQRL